MRKLTFILMFFIFIGTLKSQDYKLGIGYRGLMCFTKEGSDLIHGASIKYLFEHDGINNLTAEGIYSSGKAGYAVTALLEIQNRFNIKSMRYNHIFWYYGLGVHSGSYNIEKSTPAKNFNIGANAVLGFDYVLYDFPLSIGFDILPYYDFIKTVPTYINLGVSVRYVIK